MRLFRRIPKEQLCPVPGCTNEGTPVLDPLPRDPCPEHAAQKAADARAAAIDPAELEQIPYDGNGYGRRLPCRCGHPHWAHCSAAYFDGRCCVPECKGCADSGYVPAQKLGSR